jgi:APA family basic amino acid/polyamine antiporter
VPLLGAGFCIYLMTALPIDTWARLIVWMALGVAIYVFYVRKHSKLNR